MSAFVDTSALYALLVRSETEHGLVRAEFERLIGEGRTLKTSNYVLVETSAVLQSRLGLSPVRDLFTSLVPMLEIHWVAAALHQRALERLVRADRRGLSLVDCTSFEVMEAEGVRDALALDDDFAREGFRLMPAPAAREAPEA